MGGYKLYDFTKPVLRSGEMDPNFGPQLDEQLRFFADLLFFNNQDYPGQLSGGAVAPLWLNGRWWSAKAQAANNTVLQLNGSDGVLVSKTANAGTAAAVNTIDETFAAMCQQVSGTAGTWQGPAPNGFFVGSNASGNMTEAFDVFPYWRAKCRFHSNTNVRYHLGITNAGLANNNNNPWGTGTGGGGIAFRIATGIDQAIYVVTKKEGTSGLSGEIETNFTLSADVVYTFEIVCWNGTGGTQRAACFINGQLVAGPLIQGDNYLAKMTSGLTWNIVVIPQEAAVKTIGVSSVIIGTRPQPNLDLDAYPGFLGWYYNTFLGVLGS